MTRHERYARFLARSHARLLDRLAQRFAELAANPNAIQTGADLDNAAAKLAEALARLLTLPPRQRRPHRRPNARKTTRPRSHISPPPEQEHS
ncbi:MAG TPA: hypothetical protein VH643_21150 [Gemmataceae bacterium]|jgi:hypothetical protein